MDGKEYQDPDYPGLVKQEGPVEKWAKLERARDILKREIQCEINARETELATIDQRMWRARRVLHRLRVTLLQQQYGTTWRDESREPHSRSQVSAILRNKQTRLHPSQRRLTNTSIVGREEIFPNLTHGKYAENYTKPEDDSVTTLRRGGASETDKLGDNSVEDVKKPKKIPRHIEPDTSDQIVTLHQGSRSRQKHRYRIIIGNTSKYSLSGNTERCSHSWLLYIRCSGDVVKSATVRLHESYAPHHVCHLRTHPLQVSRRGWGEFPARVELHFAMPQLNPPAAVEHTLRLDKRCTGLTSLGAETIVDVWLYSNSDMLRHALKDETQDDNEKTEGDDQWGDFFSTNTTELDIDEMIIKPVKKTNFDIDNAKDDVAIKEEPIDYDVDEMDLNSLDIPEDFDDLNFAPIEEANGENVVAKSIDTNVVSIDKKVKLEHSVKEHVNKKVEKYLHIKNDHCYIPVREFPQLVSASVKKLQNGKKHRFDLGEVVSKLNCVRSAVNFLFGKIPLVVENADAYKFMFPFVVASDEVYWKMGQIRRRNAEWSRAKIINKILTKYFPDKSSIWRTKQILYFGRLHGYTPTRPKCQDSDELSSWNDHETQWELHQDMKKAYPLSSDIHSGSVFDESRFEGKSCHRKISEPVVLPCDSDDELDVVNVAGDVKSESASPVKKKLEVLPIENEEERLQCFFIEKTCSHIGIELRNEDVGNGYTHSAVHRVILSAVRSLAAELTRAALAETRGERPALWTQDMEGDIGLHHVFAALRRSDRLNVFTMDSLYAPHTDYNERL